MEQINTLKNQYHEQFGNQMGTPHKEDNLERQIRGQLEKLKKNPDISKIDPIQTQHFDIYSNEHKNKRIRGANSLNTNTFIENSQINQFKIITPISQKHDQLNNINSNNLNKLRPIKQDKQNMSPQISQNNCQKQINQLNNSDQFNESEMTDIRTNNTRSKINTPNRKRRHPFVDSKNGQNNNNSRGSYPQIRLKQQFDDKESNGQNQETQNIKNSMRNYLILPQDNIQPKATCQKSQRNSENEYKKLVNIQNTYSVKSNHQNNKYTNKSFKKDGNTNSNLDKFNCQNQQNKESPNLSPLRALQNRNNCRITSSQSKVTSFYDNNNSTQKRINSSYQKYPILMKKNENNSSNTSYIHENSNQKNNRLKNNIIEQENCLQQQLKLQMKEYNYQQTPTQIQLQIQKRKSSLFRKQQEIEKIFQQTKEQLYTSQIEKMSSVGQHILEQRDKYFNQNKNDFLMQQPSKNSEPIRPVISQESIAIATQGSQYDMQSYKKVSANELLSKDEKTDFIGNNQRYKLNKKKSNNVEFVRISQGENGCLIMQGDNQNDKNILCRNSYDQSLQNDKLTDRTNSNKSSQKIFHKKNLKKTDHRYMNSSMKYSQDLQLQSFEGRIQKQYNNSQNKTSNNQNSEDYQNSLRVFDKQLEQLDEMEVNSNNDSGIVIYKQREDEQISFEQSEQNKENIETKSGIKMKQSQKQSFLNLKSYPNVGKVNQNNSGSDCSDENEEGDDNRDQSKERYKVDQTHIQKQNKQEDEIVSRYVIGSMTQGIQQNSEIKKSMRLKKGKSIDNYFKSKYNIDISFDKDKECVDNIDTERIRKRKKSKRRKNRNKTGLIGDKDESYKFKVSKNIMGVYCAKKQIISSPDKFISIKGYIK